MHCFLGPDDTSVVNLLHPVLMFSQFVLQHVQLPFFGLSDDVSRRLCSDTITSPLLRRIACLS